MLLGISKVTVEREEEEMPLQKNGKVNFLFKMYELLGYVFIVCHDQTQDHIKTIRKSIFKTE